jgi:3-methyladenine DNA glycosylase AlkD
MARGLLDDLAVAFEENADAERARGMSAYMRDQFPYYGIAAPLQRSLAREVLANHPAPDEPQLARLARDCWTRPQREWQYFACDLMARHAKTLSARFLPHAKRAITTKSWWDTVDSLASKTVGGLVLSAPDLRTTMDRWAGDRNIWLARTAILHQLSYKERTDAERLFRYCELRAGDTEFFIRKAIGWALREYSKTDEAAVRAFVRTHDDTLSGLSKREALKWFSARPRG